jgi:hypothetical protein
MIEIIDSILMHRLTVAVKQHLNYGFAGLNVATRNPE